MGIASGIVYGFDGVKSLPAHDISELYELVNAGVGSFGKRIKCRLVTSLQVADCTVHAPEIKGHSSVEKNFQNGIWCETATFYVYCVQPSSITVIWPWLSCTRRHCPLLSQRSSLHVQTTGLFALCLTRVKVTCLPRK